MQEERRRNKQSRYKRQKNGMRLHKSVFPLVVNNPRANTRSKYYQECEFYGGDAALIDYQHDGTDAGDTGGSYGGTGD